MRKHKTKECLCPLVLKIKLVVRFVSYQLKIFLVNLYFNMNGNCIYNNSMYILKYNSYCNTCLEDTYNETSFSSQYE
jgi:hypothetical protein